MSSNDPPVLLKLRSRGASTKFATATEWDDKYLGDLAQIVISYDAIYGLRSLQFVYLGQDGNPCITSERGGSGDNVYLVNLNPGDGEQVVKVSGHYNSVHIKSIQFTTHKNEYGPFGESETGSMTPFTFNCDSGIVSFHGSSSENFIYKIGVNVKAAKVKA